MTRLGSVRSVEIPDVLALFYQAAFDPALWPSALDAVARCFNARGAILPSSRFVHGNLPHSPGMGDVLEQFFAEDWHLRDQRTIAAQRYDFDRDVITDQLMFSVKEIAQSRYYSGFARAAGVPWFCAASLSGSRGGEYIALSLQRSAGQGMFTGQDVAKLSALLPHLRNAAELAQRILNLRAKDLLEGLERAGTAAVLLRENGRILAGNARFERLSHPALRVKAGRVSASDPSEQRAFAALLGQIGAAQLSPEAPSGRLALRGQAEGAPLLLRAAPFRAASGSAFGTDAVLVTLVDLAAELALRDDILRDLFQLTSREAQVMALLGRGQSLEQIAALLALSKETIRFHLKAILGKTGAHRQSELVALCHKIDAG